MRDRSALVTGAANGIGRATATRLVQEGARVALVDVDANALPMLGAELGVRAKAIVADVSIDEERSRGFEAARAAFGDPDILVNCVGGSTRLPRPDLPLEEMSDIQWDSMMAFNLKTAFVCCRDFIGSMKRLRKGAIVNVSSISGRGVTPQSGVAYATAKAGLVGFTRRLAAELAPFGVRCNAVAPGYVMTDRIRRNLWDPASSAARSHLMNSIPLGRFAEPEEVASVIAFLASDDASYLTGVTVDCNGGIVSY